MIPSSYGFREQLELFDVVAVTTVQSIDTILKANAAYQTALGKYSSNGNADNVAVACTLQVLSGGGAGLYVTERFSMTPSAAVGHFIAADNGIVGCASARSTKIVSASGTTTVRIGYYLAGS
jgi:hypothetical protein